MGTQYTAYLVPHTHWDRAWYLPFEEFRLRLVRLIDRLVAILEQDSAFTTFCLDGQSIILEDYLQIRPDMADRLRKLIKAKRLWVGPWYTLPDEFLVSGEAMIRNLLQGRRIAQSYGRSMNVGYVPDTFGHIAQLPQLLRGFGLDTFIFARGLYPPDNDLKLEFTWKSPDGSEVLALHQRFHYNNAVFLGYRLGWGDTENLIADKRLAVQQIGDACAALEPYARSRFLLLNNGVDHSEAQADLPSIVEEAQAVYPQYRLKIGSFEDYAKAVKRDLEGTPLQKKQGELYFDYGDILHGVYSARMYLKQENRYCQDLLEKFAEPLGALTQAAGLAPYPADMLGYVWRTLMKNHPHDDICGCSVDPVHADMEDRFRNVRIAGEALVRDAARSLSHAIDHGRQSGVPVMLFNPLAVERNEVCQFDIDLSLIDEPWLSLQLFDEEGNELAYETLSQSEAFWMEPLKGFQVRRHRVQIPLTLPSVGYRTLYVRQGNPHRPQRALRATAKACDTPLYKLTFAKDGSITVRDKATGKRHRGLLTFENREDCGDLYNWSFLESTPKRITTKGNPAEISLTHANALSATWTVIHTMTIPAGLAPDRQRRSEETVPLRIVSEVTCTANSPRIDIVTRVENNATDHRLRVLFPASVESNTVDVDGHFMVHERSVEMPPARELPPYPTQHQGRFAALRDQDGGLAVINDGLPEIEVLCEKKKRILALTLFRAVGWLSRNDYPTRRVHAGPPLETPGGQCLRTMTFRYAVMVCDGDLTGLHTTALAHNVAPLVTRADIHGGTDVRSLGIPYDDFTLGQPMLTVPREGTLPPTQSMLSIGSSALQLSAIKIAETRSSLIIRVYNPGPHAENGELALWKPISEAWSTRLDEERIDSLETTKGRLKFSCPGYAIRTFECVLQEKDTK